MKIQFVLLAYYLSPYKGHEKSGHPPKNLIQRELKHLS